MGYAHSRGIAASVISAGTCDRGATAFQIRFLLQQLGALFSPSIEKKTTKQNKKIKRRSECNKKKQNKSIGRKRKKRKTRALSSFHQRQPLSAILSLTHFAYNHTQQQQQQPSLYIYSVYVYIPPQLFPFFVISLFSHYLHDSGRTYSNNLNAGLFFLFLFISRNYSTFIQPANQQYKTNKVISLRSRQKCIPYFKFYKKLPPVKFK